MTGKIQTPVECNSIMLCSTCILTFIAGPSIKNRHCGTQDDELQPKTHAKILKHHHII